MADPIWVHLLGGVGMPAPHEDVWAVAVQETIPAYAMMGPPGLPGGQQLQEPKCAIYYVDAATGHTVNVEYRAASSWPAWFGAAPALSIVRQVVRRRG